MHLCEKNTKETEKTVLPGFEPTATKVDDS